MRWFVVSLVLLMSLGCKKGSSDVVGNWNMNGPLGLMIVEFKPDGTYGGKFMGAGIPADMKGTYKVDGKVLQMDAPTLTVNGQSQTPAGGAMRMSMDWKTRDMVLLDNGSQKLTMTRNSPTK